MTDSLKRYFELEKAAQTFFDSNRDVEYERTLDEMDVIWYKLTIAEKAFLNNRIPYKEH